MKEGWEIKKLEEVCELITCGVAASPKYVSSGIPFLSAKNLKKGKVIWDDYKLISKETHEKLTKKNKPLVGDILYTRVGSYGEAAIIETNREFSVFVSLTLIKLKEILNNFYLKYFLNSDSVKKIASANISGSGVGNLNVGTVRKFEIPLPPLDEQKAIVKKLDQTFKAIDQAKANVEQNLSNAENLFQSQLNQIFSQTGEGWEEKKLKEIGEIQTGTTPSTKNKEYYGDYIAFAKPGHFEKDGNIHTKESKLSKAGLKKGRLIKENSILMVCIGATIGKTGYSESKLSSNQQINSLTPEGKVEPKIFYYALISPFVQKQILESGKSAQATLPIINKSKWSNIKARFPLDIEEQKKYVIKLQKTRELTDMTKTKYQQKLESLEELKQSILEKAFKGELV